ncbi:hypothetical protein EBAPG3_007450 [Nitrosospira lacus]|uniref:Uncharacterized protein n=1 Tax=Nitrosospira lacus TaxID=1288494 RepID=A0A1W6SP82_9PROT|nr:hypothetical protein EBAPG3_007450 [Nitrosospira lacus]
MIPNRLLGRSYFIYQWGSGGAALPQPYLLMWHRHPAAGVVHFPDAPDSGGGMILRIFLGVARFR